jgi:hypothetical protein
MQKAWNYCPAFLPDEVICVTRRSVPRPSSSGSLAILMSSGPRGKVCWLSHYSLAEPALIVVLGRDLRAVVTTTEKDYSPNAALALWHRAWPLAAVTIAVGVNLVWIGLLAYGLAKLLL